MKKNNWENQVVEALQKCYMEPPKSHKKAMKSLLMKHISQKQELLSNTAIITSLKKSYVPAPEAKEIRIKNDILASIRKTQERKSYIWNSFSFKAATAMALSLTLFLSTIITIQHPQSVIATEGIYIQAREEGKVTVDGEILASNNIIVGKSGSIITGPANIIAPSKGIIRLADEATIATLFTRANNRELTIKLSSGVAWAQSLSIPVRILGNSFNADTTYGSSSVTIDPIYTRIFSTNITNVQISQNSSEQVTNKVFPDEQLLINNRSLYTRKDHSFKRVSNQELAWINKNLQHDQYFVMQTREKNLTKERNNAGALPGELLYNIEQWVKSAKTFTNTNKPSNFENTLELAAKNFSKALALFEKGDETIAQLTLQAFEHNVLFAAESISDKLPQERQKLSLLLIDFLSQKEQSLTAVTGQEPLAIAKRRINSLQVNIAKYIEDKEIAIQTLVKAAKQNLAAAHNKAQQNEIELAIENLENYLTTSDLAIQLAAENASTNIISKMAQKTTEDLAILNKLQSFPELTTFAQKLMEQNQNNFSTFLSLNPLSAAKSSISGTIQ